MWSWGKCGCQRSVVKQKCKQIFYMLSDGANATKPLESRGSCLGITSALILDAEQKQLCSEDWRPVTERIPQNCTRIRPQDFIQGHKPAINVNKLHNDRIWCVDILFDGLTAHVVEEMRLVREILASWPVSRCSLFWPRTAHLRRHLKQPTTINAAVFTCCLGAG